MAMARRVRHPRCKWCKKRLDAPRHRNKSESLCFVQNMVEIRSQARPHVEKVSEVYQSGKLRSEFIGTDMESILLKRQYRLALNASLGLDCPKNLRYILEQEFVYGQIVHEKPWAVMWLSDGVRKRKRFNNIWSAIEFWNKARRLNATASIVSLARAYELPAGWRFKKDQLPKRFKWCPHCVTWRVYKRVYPEERFWAMVKYETVDNKGNPKFDWAERKLFLTACELCGNTNRHSTFRRANQPYELRTIKPGKSRVRRRKNQPPSQLHRRKKRKRRT